MSSRSGPLTQARHSFGSSPAAWTIAILMAATATSAAAPLVGPIVALLTPLAAVGAYRGARTGWLDSHRTRSLYLVAMLAAIPAVMAGPMVEESPRVGSLIWALIGSAVVAWTSRRPRNASWSSVVVVMMVAASALVLVWATFSAKVLDVWLLQRDASEMLISGRSPYSGLAVPNGAPTADDTALIEGYSYPITALIPFSVASSAGFDPRLGAIAMWGLSVLGFSRLAIRNGRSTVLVATFAMSAGTVLILWSAATEPITIALVVGAAAVSTYPRLGSVLLGLALSSKQYLVVLAPLLLSPWLKGFHRRYLLVSAALGLGIGVAIDPPGFWRNAVMFHLQQPPRSDSMNPTGLITALGYPIPYSGLLGMLAGLWVAWGLRKGVVSLAGWLRASAAVLAVTFAMSPQAFSNYWFLVLNLILLAEAVEQPTPVSP